MEIRWEQIGPREKQAVVELCGWCNKKGTATPTGKRIANTTRWESLTSASRNVLMRHGIKQ